MIVYCDECGKCFERVPSGIVESGKKFCSHSCSASNRNKGRKRTTVEKEKTALKLRKKELDHVCIYCKKSFHRVKKSKYCSKRCYLIDKHGRDVYSKEELERDVTSYIIENEHIPTSKINYRWAACAVRNYGSWNKFISSIGKVPNKQYIERKKIRCVDNHISDSLSEKIIDDWLYKNEIKHERSVSYPGSKKTCDFFLTDYDIWIEYLGLAGEYNAYDLNTEAKRKIAKENNLTLVEIYSYDLFPENKLKDKLGIYI